MTRQCRHAAQRAAARRQDILLGGVALNQEVVSWLKHDCPGLIDVPEQPHLVAAYGAALCAKAAGNGLALAARGEAAEPDGNGRFPWPLTLEKSTHPSFATRQSYEDRDGNEVRVTRWPEGEPVRACSASTSGPPARRPS